MKINDSKADNLMHRVKNVIVFENFRNDNSLSKAITLAAQAGLYLVTFDDLIQSG